ncbi:MAG: damage-inducible protein [Alphaproteobacteria bacterium RIFCSPLOWO2_01_FULL_40_26]|nr:MAG: damage-inducible protein [Alphaproteobacteria bacterium RIFCSPHIGHO2_02_FULL_40_34]OFW87554.1 MAG: damage-inducible protein [Alphaproteobacteria bacterium RIFCSPHIGHO2_01_FULL_40_8]OFW94488.1 MAG: damage-inducible protein [Alphaproteobacteria bacterium RIFCSPLOWO2_01_FULL_40_26]OFX10199.1 MAG: damage-inducible protein [Alphaproteobacteria bacterium RIFCSPLOWO2_02_FULL_40_19]OFX11222.1 MAG: damage-inducible protein [Alphaproteobacteria bacterium RIFCSPLOWO2_12_FULL_40_11]
MNLKTTFSNRFVKEYKLMARRGKNLDRLKVIVELLETGSLLPIKYHNHKLVGEYSGSWELHIEPDWLLIYRISNEQLILERTGSHSDLFRT